MDWVWGKIQQIFKERIVKFKRIFWILFYRLYCKYYNINVGEDLRICNHLIFKFSKNSKINIGQNFAFSSGAYNPLSRNIKGTISMEDNAVLTIGNNVGISSSCLWVFDYLNIGNNVKIGADCIIFDSDAHSQNYLHRRNGNLDRINAIKRGITIEEDVLVGTRCIILKGVTIGARSIIGSGSVVTKSIPPDEVWAGNPAKFLKKL